jgi:hypothetical protein
MHENDHTLSIFLCKYGCVIFIRYDDVIIGCLTLSGLDVFENTFECHVGRVRETRATGICIFTDKAPILRYNFSTSYVS